MADSARTLSYVDYSINNPHLVELRDSCSVCDPEISPNGRYVAYATANEDSPANKQSKICIRNLEPLASKPVEISAPIAFKPHWWVNPSTNDTFIIFTNSLVDCNSAEWSSTKTFKQKISNGKPVGSPFVLIQEGGFHDGLSPDGKFAVTSKSDLKMKNMITGEIRRLFSWPQNGKSGNSSTQICTDASICPDSAFSGFCMFLDNGYGGISALVHEAYRPNQYLFFVDFWGNVAKWIKSPSNEYSWMYPRWSNQVNYAVSVARDAAGNGKNLYLIKLSKESFVPNRLLSGKNIADPCLWISRNFASKFDSAGRYDLPANFAIRDIIAGKMAGFWRYHDSMEIVFVGTSHTHNGIDPASFARKVWNLGIPAFQLYESLSILNDYVLNHCKHVKLIGMDLIINRLFLPKPDSLKSNLYGSTGYLFDRSHDFWRDSIPKAFLRSYDRLPFLQQYEGYLANPPYIPCRGWGSEHPDVPSTTTVSLSDPDYLRNLEELKRTANVLRKRKIHFLLFISPISPRYASTPYYGPEGPSPEVAKAVVTQIHDLEKSNPFLHLYDAHEGGSHDYTDHEAADYYHLCSMGARKLSKRLDSLISEILK